MVSLAVVAATVGDGATVNTGDRVEFVGDEGGEILLFDLPGDRIGEIE